MLKSITLYAISAEMERRGIALSIHDLGSRYEWMAKATLRPLYPEKDLLFILKEAGSALGKVGTGARSVGRTRTQILDH
jgi:hypothetical protein